MQNVVITHAVRTPIGKIGKSLRDVGVAELAGTVLKELVHHRARLQPQELDHVILGEVRQSSDPSNIARVASLLAGLPETLPAYTVHRQCGSGLQAIIDAFSMIACKDAGIVAAGGAENMSQSVYFMRGTRDGLGNGDYIVEDSLTHGALGSVPEKIFGILPMGLTAENLAERYNISRKEQDIFAQRSQERAAAAIANGFFDSQIMPVASFSNTNVLRIDEHPFLTSFEKLAALPPAFKKNGSVTAGNSSGRNDGAAAVLLASEEKAAELGLTPIARLISTGTCGCEPAYMGLGPVESTKIALERANLSLGDMDVIELNEAFASQSIAVMEEWKAWGIPEKELIKKVNPNGGAIALGHPLGCTGAALTVKCVYELLRVPSHRYGLITLCCAGGQGIALILKKYVGDFNE